MNITHCRLKGFSHIGSACRQLLLLCMLASLLSGCAADGVLTSYPAQMASVKAALDNGNNTVVNDLASKIKQGNPLLYAQEAGRAAQIGGDFSQSIDFYQQAMRQYEQLDERAHISVTHVGASSSSLVLNDKVVPYEGNLSERILVHQYQALNYLFSGNPADAQVEMRRTNELQAMQQTQLEKDNKTAQKMANGEISAEVDRLKAIGDTPLNAGSYYLTGLLHELFGQANDAFIDYRKAANLLPDNPLLQQNLLRLADTLKMPQLDEFTQRWGQPTQPSANQGRLVIMLERGFVSPKNSIDLPIVTSDKILSISLPSYAGVPELAPVPSSLLGKNTVNFTPLSNLTQIEAAELSSRLPMIYTRQAARFIAKNTLANNTRGDTTGAAIGNFLIQIFNVVTEQADRRSWLTLPAQLDLLDNYTEQGQYQLHYGSYQQSVTIQPGKTTLVWIIDTGNLARFYTKSL